MRVFFNAKSLDRRMKIRLHSPLAFLHNSLSLLLRKAGYDLSKSAQTKKTRRNAGLF